MAMESRALPVTKSFQFSRSLKIAGTREFSSFRTRSSPECPSSKVSFGFGQLTTILIKIKFLRQGGKHLHQFGVLRDGTFDRPDGNAAVQDPGLVLAHPRHAHQRGIGSADRQAANHVQLITSFDGRTVRAHEGKAGGVGSARDAEVLQAHQARDPAGLRQDRRPVSGGLLHRGQHSDCEPTRRYLLRDSIVGFGESHCQVERRAR